MGARCGIRGLSNTGRSSRFNWLTLPTAPNHLFTAIERLRVNAYRRTAATTAGSGDCSAQPQTSSPGRVDERLVSGRMLTFKHSCASQARTAASEERAAGPLPVGIRLQPASPLVRRGYAEGAFRAAIAGPRPAGERVRISKPGLRSSADVCGRASAGCCIRVNLAGRSSATHAPRRCLVRRIRSGSHAARSWCPGYSMDTSRSPCRPRIARCRVDR